MLSAWTSLEFLSFGRVEQKRQVLKRALTECKCAPNSKCQIDLSLHNFLHLRSDYIYFQTHWRQDLQ